MISIGLMSGTSLDGCDAALVKIENDKFHLLDFYTLPYQKDFVLKLKKNLSDDTAKLSEICSLNFELGYIFKDAIDEILKRNNLHYSDIDYVCSHGQTIWHNPHGDDNQVPSTLQIGDAQVISTLTGIKVVSNLRVADIVAGGEGAPLVPMFEYLYFKEKNKSILLQNLGGIGNVTYLKKDCNMDEVIAMDTGPGNVMIDYFTNKYFNIPYDVDSKISLSGDIIIPVLNGLIAIFNEFITRTPPKSTGRELFSSVMLEDLAQNLDFDLYSKQDIITTITEFTVYTIVYNYTHFIPSFDKVIVNGGGSHNKYIMNRLKEELNVEVFTLDEATGITNFSDAKEAFAFAVLGYLSLNGKCGNVKKATGAKFDLVLGQITLARKEKIRCR